MQAEQNQQAGDRAKGPLVNARETGPGVGGHPAQGRDDDQHRIDADELARP